MENSETEAKLMTWDQLEAFGPLDVRCALKHMPRLVRDNEPIPFHAATIGLDPL